MSFLRFYLAVAFIVMLVYTLIVASGHGMNLAPVFIEQVMALNWSGQFNVDFLTYLWLSALWIAWRHEFSIGGIVIALLASVLGMVFFAPYVIWASFKANGNMSTLLLGESRT